VATTDELYNAIQQFKLYIQQNFPFKHTVFEGTADPTVGAGIIAPIGAFYAQKDGSGNVLKLWLKKTAVATSWEDVSAGGAGSGVLLWQPNTAYTTFADSGVPALIWETDSAKFYYNTADFTSEATFAADQLLGRWTELSAGGANPMLPINTWDMTGAITPATLSAAVFPPEIPIPNDVVIVDSTFSVSASEPTVKYGVADLGEILPSTGKFYIFWSPGEIVGGTVTTAFNLLFIGNIFETPDAILALSEVFGLGIEVQGGTYYIDPAFVPGDVAAIEFDLDTGTVGIATSNVYIADILTLDPLNPNLSCAAWGGKQISGAVVVQTDTSDPTTLSSRLSSSDNFGLTYTPPVGYIGYGSVGDAVPPAGVEDGNRFRVTAPGTYAGNAAQTNDLVEFRNSTANIFVYKHSSSVVTPETLAAGLIEVESKIDSKLSITRVQNIYNSSADQPAWTATDVGLYFLVGTIPTGDFSTATFGQLAKVISVTSGTPTFTFISPLENDRIFYVPFGVSYVYDPNDAYLPSVADSLTELKWIHDSSHPKYQGLERWNATSPYSVLVDDENPNNQVYLTNTAQYHRVDLVANNTSLSANVQLYLNTTFLFMTDNAPTTGTIEIEVSGGGNQPLTLTVPSSGGGTIPTKGFTVYTFDLDPPNFNSYQALLLEYKITNGTLALEQIYPTPAPNIPVVTTDYNGLMSVQDKRKLDNLDDSVGFGSYVTTNLPNLPLIWSDSFSTPFTKSTNDEIIFTYQSNGSSWATSYINRSSLLESSNPTWTTYTLGSQLVKSLAYSPLLDMAIGISILGNSLTKFSGFNNNYLSTPSIPSIPGISQLKGIIWSDVFKAFIAYSDASNFGNKVLYSTDGDTWLSATGFTSHRYLGIVPTEEGVICLMYNGFNVSLYKNAAVNWQSSFPGSSLAITNLSRANSDHCLAINKYGTVVATDGYFFYAGVSDQYTFYKEVFIPANINNLVYSKDLNCFIGVSTGSFDTMFMSPDGLDWTSISVGDGTATNAGFAVHIQGTPYVAKWTAPALTLNTFKYGPTLLTKKADLRANQAISPVLKLLDAPLEQVNLMTSKDGWLNMTLVNSWIGPIAATRKNGNRVDFVLDINSGTTGGIGSVPVNCRPTYSIRLPAVVSNSNSGLLYHGHIYIDATDGGVQLITNPGDFIPTDIAVQLNATYFILPTA